MNDDTALTRQSIANRKNGKKGGVKTSEGKEISSLNAKVHGIFSLRIFPHEQTEYMHLYDSIREEFSADMLIENVLVERLAFHILQMQRVSFARNEFLLQCENKGIVIDRSMDFLTLPGEVEVIEEPYLARLSPSDVEKLSGLYQRYEIAVENRFYKALRELSHHKKDS